jgi:hypothetical protein
MAVAASGRKGTGPSCINNCTTGTPPPLDCMINPNDPSCPLVPQSAIPLSTKTCPDGFHDFHYNWKFYGSLVVTRLNRIKIPICFSYNQDGVVPLDFSVKIKHSKP